MTRYSSLARAVRQLVRDIIRGIRRIVADIVEGILHARWP